METLQNIWNFIADFYNQNALSIWMDIGIVANFLLFLQIFLKISARNAADSLNKEKEKLVETIFADQKEIERLKYIIDVLNSKFVEVESDNLPKRDHKTGRFTKR